MKKILGILILVLFLGTVMAGLAQGNSVTHTPQKTGSSMPSEIKPYIIVKRTVYPTYHIEPLNKWGGTAVQNSKFGIDLVVRAKTYAYYPDDTDNLRINATVIAAGSPYYLGNNEWWKMKYLWLGASKDYLPGQVGDSDVGIEIPTIKNPVAMHNLTDKKDYDVEWINKIENAASVAASYVAGTAAGAGAAASGPLAPFAPVISAGSSYAASTATRYIFDNLKSHIINNPKEVKSVAASNTALGYAYAKGVLRRWWFNDSAAMAINFQANLCDEPSKYYENHVITIKAILGYDIAKKGTLGWEWEDKTKTIETYVTIHVVADDTNGVGEPKSSSQYALTGSYSYGQSSYTQYRYIDGSLSNIKDSTAGSPVIGNMGWMMYITKHPTQYQLQEAEYKYYEGLITGSDSEDYYQFTFDPNVVPHSDLYDAYQIKVYLIAGRGAPMMMDIHYRGIDYLGYTTKGKGMTSFEIWTPAWKSGQTQGQVIKIRVHPDVVTGTENGNKIYTTSEGLYLLYCSVAGYKDVGNYQPYVHITGVSSSENHVWVSFHAEDKKNADWDNGLLYSYTVYWGDGTKTPATHLDVNTLDTTVDHLYSMGGSYHITVKVEDYYSDTYGDSIDREGIDVSVGGGSGGGGCPFLYTYSGNNWREENNVLVWAENATRPFLETGDYYVFNATEMNHRVTIGIGEPGQDTDYIDAVKLYKVVAPEGYHVAESYNGMVYAYRDVESGIAIDNHGVNVTSLINKPDGNYWTGEKGDYIDITLNLSSENLLIIRGIDNPPTEKRAMLAAEVTSNPPHTESTVWVYANVSNEWVKLGEIKVRHNLHTNVINLDSLHMLFGNRVELRFEMRDRNGIDFIGVAHDYRLATLERVKLEYASYGYSNLSYVDGNYLTLNPGDFVRMSFEGDGNGLYLAAIYGFYFNHDMVGKGIGIVRENVVNIAEAKLQNNLSAGENYVLLPLLHNYSGIKQIIWYVDGMYVFGEKPVVSFTQGTHTITLWVLRNNGNAESFSMQVSVS